MFKCMDLSKIVLQRSILQRKDWDWVWWLMLEGGIKKFERGVSIFFKRFIFFSTFFKFQIFEKFQEEIFNCKVLFIRLVKSLTIFILCQKPILWQKWSQSKFRYIYSIKLEYCVQICPNCSGFDHCGRIRLRSAKHFLFLLYKNHSLIVYRLKVMKMGLASELLIKFTKETVIRFIPFTS